MRRIGPVFHMLSSLDELGRAGYTAIGDSAEEASTIYEQVHTTLLELADEAGSSSTHPAAVSQAACGRG